MRSRRIPDVVTHNFLEMVKSILRGAHAYIPLDSVSAPDEILLLNPPSDTAYMDQLTQVGLKLLGQVIVIKLNGGRSTTMGGDVPKGILTAKNGRSYLEIISGQVKAIENQWDVRVPLVLMNSFFTQDATLDVIRKLDIPIITFVQNQFPRLQMNTLVPLDTGTEDDWAPPGHGDVYESLYLSGLLDQFIASGRRWAFISNVDNLAASLEPWILGLIEKERASFLMEVTERTDADRKGGTLVVRDGKLDLLEIAQVAPGDKADFADIRRFPVFNTNNIWVDLHALRDALDNDTLHLPIIQNAKDVGNVKVIQIETAMGAAIGSFEAARGLKVSRHRFFPTKSVEDLFVLQSDACILDHMDRIRPNPRRPPGLPLRPTVVFGSDFLNSPLEMDIRFEDASSVSLVKAGLLEVHGSVFFERDVRIEGRVSIQPEPGHTFICRKGTTLQDGLYPT